MTVHPEYLLLQYSFTLAVEVADCLVPENATDYGGLLEQSAFLFGQAFQPGLQHTGQRGGYSGLFQLLFINNPMWFTRDDHPRLNQYLDQFLHVERVAFSVGDD